MPRIVFYIDVDQDRGAVPVARGRAARSRNAIRVVRIDARGREERRREIDGDVS
jgi:hypothetical protein